MKLGGKVAIVSAAGRGICQAITLKLAEKGTNLVVNINVNCICPGIIYTDFWKQTSETIVQQHPEYKGQDPRKWFSGIFKAKYLSNENPIMTPMRREQTVDDIADTAIFLVSEEARNITLQAINVDDGVTKA